MRTTSPRRGILILDGVLADAALEDLAARAGPYPVQQLGPGRGRDGLPERREHASIDDQTIADVLWASIADVLPPLAEWFPPYAMPPLEPAVGQRVASGCNARSRYYRYGKGDRFAPHFDEAFRPAQEQRTFLTLLLYLPTTAPCVGGETVIDGEVVTIEVGRMVILDHRLIHEGRPAESGEKLVLRNDVVGTRQVRERLG